MKTINLTLISILFLLVFTTCKKDKEPEPSFTVDCEALRIGLWDMEEDIVNTEINSLTADLSPEPITGDDLGHAANLEKLVERLNECNRFDVSIICYACIETFPLQSEIRIWANYPGIDGALGIEFERVIDILTPEDGILQAGGMHQ